MTDNGIHIKTFSFNPFGTNCHLLWDGSGQCVICDPGMCDDAENAELDAYIRTKGLVPAAVVLTHGHGDHACGVDYCIYKYNIKVYMSPADRPICRSHVQFCSMIGIKPYNCDFPAEDAAEGTVVRFGSHELRAIASPGHTPGGLVWYCEAEKLLLSGDSLFKGSIGRTDMEGGDYDVLMKSLFGKILELDGETRVLPGHGPDTEIAEERRSNPFLQPFNEPYEEETDGGAIIPGFTDGDC